MPRIIKFKGLYEATNGERHWVEYGVGSKPGLVGASWIVEDLQYTGLMDKKGKEIFEGNIVAFDRDGKDYWRELYEIRYSPYRACWQLFLLRRCNHVNSPQYISNAFTQGEADTIEVIGNIYEQS